MEKMDGPRPTMTSTGGTSSEQVARRLFWASGVTRILAWVTLAVGTYWSLQAMPLGFWAVAMTFVGTLSSGFLVFLLSLVVDGVGQIVLNTQSQE